MKTYKLGNKVKATLRAYAPGKIGNVDIKYNGQPYTIIDAAEVQVNFAETNKDGVVSAGSIFNFNIDYVDSVDISNVELTDKILNLIFGVDDEPLCSKTMNSNSDDSGIIYLPEDVMYQVFVFDDEGELESAHELITDGQLSVNKLNSNYFIVYTCDGKKGFSLNRYNNTLLTLDFEVTGNKNDNTSKFWMHLHKCSLGVNKNLHFDGTVNSIDLRFKVLKSDNDYITLQ